MINYNEQNREDRYSEKNWNAGLYLRLSRDDDKYESESISSQREILRRYVDENNDIKVYDTYIDDGWSGTNFERPGFKQMEEDLRAKKINCIIVKDLSRFARNCSEMGNYLNTIFPYLKTRFICINDNIDSFLDPESLDNIATKVKNLINEEYCHDISLKCKSSLNIRRQYGEYIGSFACYGYQKDPQNNHKLVIDEEAAEIVKLIYKKYLSGQSIRGIVRELNTLHILPPSVYKKQKYLTYNPAFSKGQDIAWTQKSVKRILSNQMYIGDMVQNVMNNISYRFQKCRTVPKKDWIIVPNTHEAIISKEDFTDVETLLKRDIRESPLTQQLSPLSGFVKCGDCKRGMIKKEINNGKKNYRYYICSTYKNRSKQLCTKHTIAIEKVEEAVLTFLRFFIKLAVEVSPILELINNSVERVTGSNHFKVLMEKQKNERQKYLKKREDLYPDYKDGLIDKCEYEKFRHEYEVKIQSIDESILSLENKLKELKQGIPTDNNFISEFKKYHSITSLTREVVCALVENVFIYEDNRIEIVLKCKDEMENLVEYLKNNSFLLTKISKEQKEILDRIEAI